LSLAIGFTLALNAALVLTFVWPAWAPQTARAALWGVVLVIWLASALSAAWSSRSASEPSRSSLGDAYAEAVTEYLKRNWIEAEQRLARLLKRDPGDCDARLMLATLLRHTARYDEARETLWRLARLADAGRWEPEIQAEHRRLDECIADPAVQDDIVQEEDDGLAGVAA